MTKLINMNTYIQGVIFPDILGMVIRCGFASSQADIALKACRLVDPSLKGDKKIFRIFRGLGKGNVDLLGYKNRRYLKREFLKLFSKSSKKLRFTFSDMRNPGYWVAYKGFFTGHDSPASKYILDLCEREKVILNAIHKSGDIELAGKLIEKELKYIYFLRSDIFNYGTDSINASKAQAYLHLHRFLHLAAVMEFDIISQENFSEVDGLIKPILPYQDSDGEYVSSVRLLIERIYKSIGYTSMESFSADLSKGDVDQRDTIRRRLDRWKSGENGVDVNAFINLIFSKNNTA